ncbi:MAG: DUF4860 domain-containing protein [Clostridiales bacterium]
MPKHTGDVFFTVLLFLLFALTGFGVVAMGANVYRHTAENMTLNYDTRTSVFYISEKVRQAPGAITLGKCGNLEGLIIDESYDGKPYETWIFCGNGKLREVTVAQGEKIEPNDGQAIMDIEDLSLKINNNILTIDVAVAKGHTCESKILLEEVMP